MAAKTLIFHERPIFHAEAAAVGDTWVVSPIVGECVGLIRNVKPAAKIVETLVSKAESI